MSNRQTADLFCRSQTADLFCRSQTADLFCRSQTAGLFCRSQIAGLFCRSQTADLFRRSQTADLFCRLQTVDLHRGGAGGAERPQHHHQGLAAPGQAERRHCARGSCLHLHHALQRQQRRPGKWICIVDLIVNKQWRVDRHAFQSTNSLSIVTPSRQQTNACRSSCLPVNKQSVSVVTPSRQQTNACRSSCLPVNKQSVSVVTPSIQQTKGMLIAMPSIQQTSHCACDVIV